MLGRGGAYCTHSNLTLFPKLEDWIFFIKLSLLFTHSRGPLAVGAERRRRGGARKASKGGKESRLGCWMRGWHNAGLGRRMNCFVLLMPFSEKGWVWTAFLKLSVSALSLSLSCLRLCCVPASGPEPLTAPGLWCSPAVPPPPRNPIGGWQAGRLGQCGSGEGMKVSGAVRGHLHTEPGLCLQLQPQLCTLTALWTSVSATITRSAWPLFLSPPVFLSLSVLFVLTHSLSLCSCICMCVCLCVCWSHFCTWIWQFSVFFYLKKCIISCILEHWL